MPFRETSLVLRRSSLICIQGMGYCSGSRTFKCDWSTAVSLVCGPVNLHTATALVRCRFVNSDWLSTLSWFSAQICIHCRRWTASWWWWRRTASCSTYLTTPPNTWDTPWSVHLLPSFSRLDHRFVRPCWLLMHFLIAPSSLELNIWATTLWSFHVVFASSGTIDFLQYSIMISLLATV